MRATFFSLIAITEYLEMNKATSGEITLYKEGKDGSRFTYNYSNYFNNTTN